MPESTCRVEDCDGVTGVKGTARGLCSKHYNRWRRTGDVNTVRKRRGPGNGPAHHSWKGADAGYQALHKRVYRARGKAKGCAHCGADDAQRYEWAMLHGTDGTDVNNYISLCRPCHRTYDLGRLTPVQRQQVRDRVAAGESQSTLAREFGIHPSVVSRGLSADSPKWSTA